MVETHGAGQGANHKGDGVNARRVNVGKPAIAQRGAGNQLSDPGPALRDLGGRRRPGRTRGGTGIVREIRLEHDATVTFTAERAKFAPYGLFGGKPRQIRILGQIAGWTAPHAKIKDGADAFPQGNRHPFPRAGGGGYGPPAERSLEAIQADLDDGYISPNAAAEVLRRHLKARFEPGRRPLVVTPRQRDSK